MATKRFPVCMNEELLEALDNKCSEMNISRNGYVNFLIAQHLKTEEVIIQKVVAILEEKIVELVKEVE